MMKTIMIIAFLAGGLGVSAPSNGDDGAKGVNGLQAFKACVAISNNSKRLACFDKASAVFDFDKTTAVLEEAVTLKKEATKAKAKVKQLAKAAEDQKKALKAKRTEDFGKKDAEVKTVDVIETEILRVRKPKVGGLIFMFTNNQVWRQADGEIPGRIKPGMKVRIKKSRIGGYLMTIKISRRTLRVKRVI